MRSSPIPLVVVVAALVLALGSVGSTAEPPPSIWSQVQAAADAVNPSLVRIHVVEVDYRSGRETKSEATGSGVIFTKEGHVITNHHVAGNAKQISCRLADREKIDAELVGTDPLTDISVLKLLPDKPREFPAAKFGDSSALRTGDYVLAMGSPLALSQSVTLGIVSNTALVMPEMFWNERLEIEGEDVGSVVRWIGHDAAISPGNSGGPLVNLKGEVVGINEISIGLGGAIPGNLALQVAQQLLSQGKVRRAWLGVSVQPLLRSTPESKGVLISDVLPGAPADKAGMKSGDVLVSLGGNEVSVRVPEELPLFNQLVAALPIGQPVEAVVERGGKRLTLQATPQEREGRRPRPQEFEEWGFTARDLTPLVAKELKRKSTAGVFVWGVRSGGPSDQAKPKMQPGDVIVEVGGKPINTVADLVAATKQITAAGADPVPTLVAYDRKAEHYLTVVKVGKDRVPDPDPELRKAWLGAATQVVTRDMAESLQLGDRTGVRVTEVYPGQDAEEAGLKVGDIIVALDGEPIPATRAEHVDVLPAMIRQYKIGTKAEFTLLRDGKEMKLPVALEVSPQSAHELRRYRDDSFDFVVRDIAFEDRVRNQWETTQTGAYVDGVSEGGWAALAHLAVGDLILDVDGKPTPDAAAVDAAMKQVTSAKPKEVVLHVQRGTHDLFIELEPKWTSG
jgi:serine protease Do